MRGSFGCVKSLPCTGSVPEALSRSFSRSFFRFLSGFFSGVFSGVFSGPFSGSLSKIVICSICVLLLVLRTRISDFYPDVSLFASTLGVGGEIVVCSICVLLLVLRTRISDFYPDVSLFASTLGVVGGGITQADEELAVYWVNTWNKGALVRQKEEAISAQGSLNIDSFFSHSFLVVEEQV